MLSWPLLTGFAFVFGFWSLLTTKLLHTIDDSFVVGAMEDLFLSSKQRD